MATEGTIASARRAPAGAPAMSCDRPEPPLRKHRAYQYLLLVELLLTILALSLSIAAKLGVP